MDVDGRLEMRELRTAPTTDASAKFVWCLYRWFTRATSKKRREREGQGNLKCNNKIKNKTLANIISRKEGDVQDL